MANFRGLSLVLGIVPVTLAQVVSWCKDQECGDCPSSVIAGPSERKTSTYLPYTGAASTQQNYIPTNKPRNRPRMYHQRHRNSLRRRRLPRRLHPTIKYEVFADLLSVPCDGEPGGILIRSPSSFDLPGCGNAIVARAAESGCLNQPIQLQETFLVQYCCGVQGCAEADLPIGSVTVRSPSPGGNINIGGHTPRSLKTAASSGGSLYLTYANGTIIPPKAVGSPWVPSLSSSPLKVRQEDCDTWQSGSYAPSGEEYYFKTFDTMIISSTVGPFEEDIEIQASYDQTIEVSTTFELSVGDPLGIITASVGVTFARSETKGLSYTFTVPAGVVGRIGFTPVFVCSTGTLTDCDGNVSDETETCAPYRSNGGAVQGDYTLVLSTFTQDGYVTLNYML